MKPFLGLGLDIAGGKVYWTDDGTDSISRASLDGTGIETLVTGIEPAALTLDLNAGKMYWGAVGVIQRSNLDGSAIEDVVTGLGLARARGISLQPKLQAIPEPSSLVVWSVMGLAIVVLLRKRLASPVPGEQSLC